MKIQIPVFDAERLSGVWGAAFPDKPFAPFFAECRASSADVVSAALKYYSLLDDKNHTLPLAVWKSAITIARSPAATYVKTRFRSVRPRVASARQIERFFFNTAAAYKTALFSALGVPRGEGEAAITDARGFLRAVASLQPTERCGKCARDVGWCFVCGWSSYTTDVEAAAAAAPDDPFIRAFVRTVLTHPYALSCYLSKETYVRLASSVSPLDDTRARIAATLGAERFTHACLRDDARALIAHYDTLESLFGVVVASPTPGGTCLYARDRYAAEARVAEFLSRATRIPKIDRTIGSLKNTSLTDEQADAVRMAVSSPVSAITGGPGVGKTTILREVIHHLGTHRVKYRLASFTGKAVSRIREQTRASARLAATLDRLISMGDVSDYEFLIIDEASMVTPTLLSRFLAARAATGAPDPRIVFVGDADQLPPIGWGSLFSTIVAKMSPAVPIARLTRNFRTGKAPQLLKAFEAARTGGKIRPTVSDEFRVCEYATPATTSAAVEEAIASGKRVGILSPYNVDVERLNALARAKIHTAAGASAANILPGDRVMMTKNVYPDDKESAFMNGDTGFVTDTDAMAVRVEFDSGEVTVFGSDAAQNLTVSMLSLAFAITIHKSQGSEFDEVIVYLPRDRGTAFVDRSLIYTAITRARKRVTIVTPGTIEGEIDVALARVAPRRTGNLAAVAGLADTGDEVNL